MSRKVLFIVNPKAGVRKKIDVPKLIADNFPSHIDSEILIWSERDAFYKIREKIFAENFDVAVAVGGDGTVNEVAKTVNHTKVALGIVPFGSGNGLARSLEIPLDHVQAIKRIASGTIKTIDSGLINDQPFFCTAGMGFDAHIGGLFASSTKRGFWSYTKITLKELFGYKPDVYSIQFNGQTIKRKAFLLTFANASQYGNDFFIAPEADMMDGLLHLTILRPFPLFMAPFLARKIFGKQAHKSAYITTFNSEEFKVRRNVSGPIHFDGEPGKAGEEIKVRVVPCSLNVIV